MCWKIAEKNVVERTWILMYPGAFLIEMNVQFFLSDTVLTTSQYILSKILIGRRSSYSGFRAWQPLFLFSQRYLDTLFFFNVPRIYCAKLDEKAVTFVFLGHSSLTKGYEYYVPRKMVKVLLLCVFNFLSLCLLGSDHWIWVFHFFFHQVLIHCLLVKVNVYLQN